MSGVLLTTYVAVTGVELVGLDELAVGRNAKRARRGFTFPSPAFGFRNKIPQFDKSVIKMESRIWDIILLEFIETFHFSLEQTG